VSVPATCSACAGLRELITAARTVEGAAGWFPCGDRCGAAVEACACDESSAAACSSGRGGEDAACSCPSSLSSAQPRLAVESVLVGGLACVGAVLGCAALSEPDLAAVDAGAFVGVAVAPVDAVFGFVLALVGEVAFVVPEAFALWFAALDAVVEGHRSRGKVERLLLARLVS